MSKEGDVWVKVDRMLLQESCEGKTPAQIAREQDMEIDVVVRRLSVYNDQVKKPFVCPMAAMVIAGEPA